MKTSRRLPATLASLVAATVILAGCNTTDTTGPNNRAATASPAAAPTARTSPAWAGVPVEEQRSVTEKLAYLQTVDRHDRVREARRLGLSEAHLFAFDVGKNVIRLKDGRDTAYSILLRLHELGRIRAAARNEHVILNVTGTANPPRQIPATAEREARTFPGYFGAPIDLRPDFAQWQFTFAQVTFTREGQARRSLHFFDAQGRAVQRLYIDSLDGIEAFEKIVQDFRADAQSAQVLTTPAEPEPTPRAEANIDTAGLLAAWDKLTDVHQFSGLLAKFDVTRLQALRVAGPARAQRLSGPDALIALLNGIATRQIEILAFVSNSANTQIFTGKIEEPTQTAGGWIRVTDSNGLNLLIQKAGIDQLWLVRKPSSVGILSTVEVYNSAGEVIVQFYSRRTRGQGESETWRELLASLPKA
ncbi:hypothetical protein AXK11_05825 [Cephaloticoccus primus]|uniref:Haemin-degrading HemS/ChuX domain-containing protein n=1 Tax=Cephaloticoccus primus TaxID=1548207 RepID=A0A139SM31_9BACT|nr:ChuX/HutX family heme-like substrate-binding protein [Cephaloticoccus primus]KXU35636.1 hypothetical protein AXK11_05825 [Cephaloticoccus primus]